MTTQENLEAIRWAVFDHCLKGWAWMTAEEIAKVTGRPLSSVQLSLAAGVPGVIEQMTTHAPDQPVQPVQLYAPTRRSLADEIRELRQRVRELEAREAVKP